MSTSSADRQWPWGLFPGPAAAVSSYADQDGSYAGPPSRLLKKASRVSS
jgi:hypothetical protein